ncbi:MAG: carbohydrate ABC transporter permease [Chloroflexi bacterium]|nr:carbohydrate ABC transporter permease [Chloroflexota bacterium]
MTRSHWRRLGTVAKYGLIGAYCVIFMLPIYFLLLTSIRTEAEVFSSRPLSPPSPPTLDHYLYIFSSQGANVGRYVLNSAVVALATSVISLTMGSLASYSIVRFRFPGSRLIAFGMLMVRMLPSIAVVIPVYVLARTAGLLNSLTVLVISYTVFNIPFVVWMMRGFFMEVPAELEECAMIDGCSRLGALARIVLPLVAPGLAATAIFTVLGSWNEFLLALVLTSTQKAQTVPVILAGQIEQYGVPWARISAMAATLMLPVLIFAMIVQKHLIRGLAFGAVKG